MAHRNVKGATTKPTEASPSDLTVRQFLDVFCWVLRVTDGMAQPDIFTVPADSQEVILMNTNGVDYASVWIVEGYPVAAGMPVEHFFRVIAC
ncbi:hypothetical protein ACI2I2_20030 [Scandinavium sp. NPDC088450]|uniref:hypothetical protein n=1 Tax=Scandinavium sp. NPDC088450 TaxID=3364514 RepID=UPI00384A6046